MLQCRLSIVKRAPGSCPRPYLEVLRGVRLCGNPQIVPVQHIVSAYQTLAGRIWIITEADRAVTTVLLPSEY